MLLQRSALGLQRGVASRLCTYGGRVQPAIVRLNRLPSTDPPSGRAASSAAPSLRSVLVRAAAAAEPAARAASFAELGLSEGLQAGLTNNNITQPTEIQVGSHPRPESAPAGRRGGTRSGAQQMRRADRRAAAGPLAGPD